MADETKPKTQPLPTVSVNRNEVDLPFVSTEIKRGSAETRGSLYLAPNATPTEDAEANTKILTTLSAWMGVKESLAVLAAHIKKKAQGWYSESVEDDGTFNKEAFDKFASSYSARGESIPSLKEEIDELLAKQQEILSNSAGWSGKMAQKDGKHLPVEILEVMSLSEEINGLRVAIASKRRMTKEEKEAAAKEAATAGTPASN